MSYKLSPTTRRQYFDDNGDPLARAKLFYYLTETTTKTNTYKDAAGEVLNTNPIILDLAGRTPAMVFLDESIIYTEVLAPATDTDPPNSPIYTSNGITSSTTFNYTAPGTGAVSRTLAAKLSDLVSVKDFGAVGDGITNDTVAIQNAVNTGSMVFFPKGTYRIVSPISSGATPVRICGEGQHLSTIFQETVNANLWDHGQVAAPVYGSTFEASDIAFKCKNECNIALNIKLHPQSAGFVLQNIKISGLDDTTTDYFKNAIYGQGCGLCEINNLTITGRLGASLTPINDAITFATYTYGGAGLANNGNFLFNISNSLILCYKTAIKFITNTYSGIEGVTINNVNANVCVNFVVHENNFYPTYTYRAPQYMISNCQFQGFGSFCRLDGVSDVWIKDNMCFSQDAGSYSLAPAGFTAQDWFWFRNSYNIRLCDNVVIVLDETTILYFVKFASGDLGCLYGQVKDNTFLLRGAGSGGIYTAADAVQIRESGTDKYIWTGSPPFLTRAGIAATAWSTTVAKALFGVMDEYGMISFSGTNSQVCNASGEITIPLPAGLFNTVSTIVVCNGGAEAAEGLTGVVHSSITTSSFVAKIVGAVSTSIRINYVVFGF